MKNSIQNMPNDIKIIANKLKERLGFENIYK